MGESTSPATVAGSGQPSRQRAGAPSPVSDGLAPHVAAVEAARAKLGEDLDQLNVEVRAQMSQTMERTTWKLASLGAAVAAAVVVRKLLSAIWVKVRHVDPPGNPAAAGTTWPDAVAWSLATGAGVGVARLVATRGATEWWQRSTGVLPPGVAEEDSR